MTQPGWADDRIEIRWLMTDALDADAWSRLASLLDTSERTRAAAFHDLRVVQSFIAAHALVRSMIARRLGTAPSSLCFRRGPTGKPELAEQPFARPLSFSLSHTAGLVAAATAFGHAVGVDAEAMADGRLDLNLTASFFAPSEVALLSRVPRSSLMATMFELWTLKEAYVKATGHGLSCPPDTYAFALLPPRLLVAAPHDADPSGWQFATWRPTACHSAALAVRGATGARVHIDLCQSGADEVAMAN